MVWAVSLLCSELSPGVLTALLPFQVFGVWLKTLRRTADSHPVALPLGYVLQDASPQAISERTSYCQTRLEFLPYTQVIPLYCTASGCGPPRGFTRASPCSYVARLASGLVHATINRPIQARFHYVSGIRHPLDSRVELTRWIVLQKARRHPLH